MAVSLHDATVRTWLHGLGAAAGFLEKGLAFCREQNIDPMEMLATRLWRAPCKGGAFQRVQAPPGNRSSRKQPEQAWR